MSHLILMYTFSLRILFQISPLLNTEIHSVKTSDIPNKLTHLILPHYDLASTTVTGIPMKEEQNASSSANYDVEIFHSSNAHSVILGTELLLPTSIKEGSKYETVSKRSFGNSIRIKFLSIGYFEVVYAPWSWRF